MSGSRIAAFVSAARSLLVVQVLAALLAVGPRWATEIFDAADNVESA